ncbi:hypothetical protein ACP4OV_021899 [Aristida adscensionis]
MKGGGDKPGPGRSPPLQLEPQRFRLLSVVVVAGCFLFFLLSSGDDAAIFDARVSETAMADERVDVATEAVSEKPEGDKDSKVAGGGGATSDSGDRGAGS